MLGCIEKEEVVALPVSDSRGHGSPSVVNVLHHSPTGTALSFHQLRWPSYEHGSSNCNKLLPTDGDADASTARTIQRSALSEEGCEEAGEVIELVHLVGFRIHTRPYRGDPKA